MFAQKIIALLENVFMNQSHFLKQVICVILKLVIQTMDHIHMQRIVMITMHVQLIHVMQQVEIVSTLQSLAPMQVHAQKILVTLSKDVSTLTNMITNHLKVRTNATNIHAIQTLEIWSKLQFFVMMQIHAQLILAILNQDVFSLQKLVKEQTNVSLQIVMQLQEIVLLLQLFVMITTNVQLIHVMETLEIVTLFLSIVMMEMHAHKIHALQILDHVFINQKFATITTFVHKIHVIQQVEIVFTLIFLLN
jgi:hypothetical protein